MKKAFCSCGARGFASALLRRLRNAQSPTLNGSSISAPAPAFTLAETMIVLTIIGILTAILLPVAIQSTPDSDIMKFKKANLTLTKAISELANSEKYFYPGDFGKDKNDNLITNPKYFCNALADILSTKSVNCSEDNLGYNSSAVANFENLAVDEINGEKIYAYADCMCANNLSSGAEIILSNNIIIYTINPYWHFGSIIEGETKRLFNLCSKEQRYKFICIDIDGLNKGELPFGYALRADGKIIYGARAQAWTKKSTQRKETDTPDPTPLASCAPTALSITPEDDSCKIVVSTPVVTPTTPATPTEPEEELYDPASDTVNFMTIGSTYVSKRNMGDSDILSIPSAAGVTVVSVGTTCSDEKCCWKGATSSNCDSANGDYSGCNRTVCTWNAAKAICENYSPDGATWRLPTRDEMANWGENSIGKGDDGLMLCDSQDNSSSTTCPDILCKGDDSPDLCFPHNVWSSDTYNETISYSYQLGGDSWFCDTEMARGNISNPMSVRCVRAK